MQISLVYRVSEHRESHLGYYAGVLPRGFTELQTYTAQQEPDGGGIRRNSNEAHDSNGGLLL